MIISQAVVDQAALDQAALDQAALEDAVALENKHAVKAVIPTVWMRFPEELEDCLIKIPATFGS